MSFIPCQQRTFPFQLNLATYYGSYLRWLHHLSERLGVQEALTTWEKTFSDYDDTYMMQILSSGWLTAQTDEADQVENKIQALIAEIIPIADLGLSIADIRALIEKTPPLAQIKQLYSWHTMEKDITAYEALHLRFDAQAHFAESLIQKYGKQGELIIYDLLIEERLASAQGRTGNVEDFFANFSVQPKIPNLFSTGLDVEMIHSTRREVMFNVRHCEWARYFHDHHPQVGYLMACSTDEVSYKAYNPNLRLQRTQTIMEGSELCNFRIYAFDEKAPTITVANKM